MPNVFREQAQDRFTRSQAFLNKADTLLQDDLVNRSALADAVSAIKNMLQGYLLLRVSHTPETAVAQHWQEVAASNSMPDLVQACGEAGLDLRGLAIEIKSLNRERNRRMHDDPDQRIEAQQAHHALELARNVQRRIKAAVQSAAVATGPEPAQSAPARIAAVARAAVSGQLGRAALRPTSAASVPAVAPGAGSSTSSGPAPSTAGTSESAPEAGANEPARAASPVEGVAAAESGVSPAAEAGTAPEDVGSPIPDETDSADDAADSGDTRLLGALTSPAPIRQRTRVGRALARALLVAALLLIGVAAGAGLMFPLATGHAPGWLAFATQYLPATPAATTPDLPTATATATATPTPSGPFVAGSLTVAPSCVGGAAVTLTNMSAQPVRWSIGSPDGAAIRFTLPGRGVAEASQSGILNGGASIKVALSGAVSGTNTLVVVSSTGTVQFPAPTC